MASPAPHALDHLYGACACERNQYTIVVPRAQRRLAEVFFDNSASNRRPQASPLTAWLRVPLDWYASETHALFPDETPATIKRAFYTSPRPQAAPTRKQFCGYCGTHLTAWSEDALHPSGRAADYLDVTLGSLLSESLAKLEALHILPDSEDENEDDGAADVPQGSGYEAFAAREKVQPGELIGGGDISVHDETHVSMRATDDHPVRRSSLLHSLQHRGVPYFEELIQDSQLGRIKRQVGGHQSRDGSTTVQWEVVEIGGDDDEDAAAASQATLAGSKRPRNDSS